jgi:hypothetical protein
MRHVCATLNVLEVGQEYLVETNLNAVRQPGAVDLALCFLAMYSSCTPQSRYLSTTKPCRWQTLRCRSTPSASVRLRKAGGSSRAHRPIHQTRPSQRLRLAGLSAPAASSICFTAAGGSSPSLEARSHLWCAFVCGHSVRNVWVCSVLFWCLLAVQGGFGWLEERKNIPTYRCILVMPSQGPYELREE